MSIFQIGAQSRNLQVSPGCRKYINPFLSNSERQQIQHYRQENQAQYRQILLDQIKQKERQRLMKKNKQKEEDIRRQKDFYQKIQKYQSRDANQKHKKHRIIGGSLSRMTDNNDMGIYDRNIFRKHAQPSLPPLHSSLMSPQQNRHMDKSSIFSPKPYTDESNYLKYNSLMDIGNKIRRDNNMGRAVTLQNEEYDFEDRRVQKFQQRVEKGFYHPERGYKELKMQLKEKESQIYDLIEKSTQFSKSTKSPIRQLKKRLKTQHVYIPSDDQEDDDSYKKPLRYRVRTQFGTRHGQDYDDMFYRLPSLPSLDWTSSEISPNKIGHESTFMPSERSNGMMKIEENPENEFIDEETQDKRINVRLNDEDQNEFTD